MKRLIVIISLFCLPAFATLRTVKPGGGGTCTLLQTCATLTVAGDTLTIFAGNYISEGAITFNTGTAGNVITIQVNGNDAVFTTGWNIGKYTDIIGGATVRPTVTGLQFQNIASPRGGACIKIDTSGGDAAHINISNSNFYACVGLNGMIGLSSNSAPWASFVHVFNNTLSYGGSTSSAPDVGYGIYALGDHWLIEGNDVSHLMQIAQTQGHDIVVRNNYFHTVTGRNTGSANPDCIPTLVGTTATISGSTLTWTGGFKFSNEFPGAWITIPDGGTKFIIATVIDDTHITVVGTPSAGTTTVGGGSGGNCHGEALFGETSTQMERILFEGNQLWDSNGSDNKIILTQCDAGPCGVAIARLNQGSHIGGAAIECDTRFPYFTSYFNTFADLGNLILNAFGTTNNFTNGSIHAYAKGNIYTYQGNSTPGISPDECDNGATTTCGTFIWGDSNAYLNGTGILYGSTFGAGLFTDGAGNTTDNPQFINYTSTGLGDLRLLNTSPDIGTGPRQATVVSCSGSTLVLDTTQAFQDGMGMTALGVQADWLRIGSTATRQISSVDSATNITLSTACPTVSVSDPVYLCKDSSGNVLKGCTTTPNKGFSQVDVVASYTRTIGTGRTIGKGRTF